MHTSPLRWLACLAVLLTSTSALADDYILKVRPQAQGVRAAAAPLPSGRPLRRGPGRAKALATTSHPFDAYRIVSVQDAQQLAELRADARVEWIEPDVMGEGGELPSDTYVDEQWPLVNTGQNGGRVDADIDAEAGWAITTGSPDVVVAVLDTGIEAEHPEFQGRLVPGYDFVNDDDDPAADHHHGVSTAGILMANADNDFGVAGLDHAARLMALKVLNAENRGSTSDLASALIYAADNGAHVANMSLINYPCASNTLRDALQYARDAGLVLVSSAGNDGEGDADASAPGCYPHVISVGATTRTDQRASFSATGQALDLVAPGSSVPTAADGTLSDDRRLFGGTSAAAPHVAGVASLMLAVDETLTHDAIKATLEGTADDQVGGPDDAPGWDEYYGFGRLNMGAALASLRPGGDVNQTANGEEAVRSAATGTLSDTFEADGVSYALRERTQGFWWTTTALEHVFRFDVQGGTAVHFELLARRDGDGGDDAFLLQYSDDDGATWNDMFVVDDTSFTAHSFTLPEDTAGALSVRAVDTDANNDGRETTLFIDHMFVRSVGGGTSCDAPPVAALTVDTNEGPAPLSVQFGDISTGDPAAWLWDFGDGTTSTARNPQHTYESPGSYDVRLTVDNACGQDQVLETGLVTVNEPCTLPAADFRADVVRGAAPLEVAFTDLSTDASEWAWNFGDGTTSSSPNPVHVYEAPGTYSVTLTVTNACGTDRTAITDYIEVTAPCEAPLADFSADVQSGPAPLTVRFKDASTADVTDWFWDFGDGTTSSAQHPVHTYEQAGSYDVQLTVDNACGEDTVRRQGVITVSAPPGGPVVHVQSLQAGSESSWWTQRGVATVRVVDATGAPVEAAQVTLVSSGPLSTTLTGSTDADGYATVRTDWTWNGGAFCFEVTEVTSEGAQYDPDANVVSRDCE